VQETNGWERFVSRLGLNYKVIVTGSSSRLLSGELGTYLTGRHIDLTLFPFSFRAYSKLGSLVGIRDVHTVRDYVSYPEEAYLLFQVRRFSFKPRAQLNSPQKVYPVDVGLAKTLSMKAHPEKGSIIELAVYLELMRRMSYSFIPGEIFYWMDEKGEVDFILKLNGKLLPIQVTYQLDGNTDREVGNIVRVAKLLRVRRGLVITWEDENEVTEGGVKIDVVPLWKFLTVFNLS